MANKKYVVFRLHGESFGINIEKVERILAEQAVTKVPKADPSLLGIFDLRGETQPAVDLRRRFDLPVHEGHSNFVVLDTHSGKCAVRVDGVTGISSVDDSDVDLAPTISQAEDAAFVSGIWRGHDGLVTLLDPDVLLSPEILRTPPAPPEKTKKKSA